MNIIEYMCVCIYNYIYTYIQYVKSTTITKKKTNRNYMPFHNSRFHQLAPPRQKSLECRSSHVTTVSTGLEYCTCSEWRMSSLHYPGTHGPVFPLSLKCSSFGRWPSPLSGHGRVVRPALWRLCVGKSRPHKARCLCHLPMAQARTFDWSSWIVGWACK